MAKPVIYQMLPRLWGEGKFSSVDEPTLDYLRELGITHVWYTGIIRHSTLKAFVKGNPGSPYSISDYYDVNPYLADDPERRMEEFEDLVSRTHRRGLKVIIDFVPNHVSRDYGSLRIRDDVKYLGDCDDCSVHWKAENDFFYYPGTALSLPDGLAWEEFPAKASGNNYSPAPGQSDWYDTIKINYCDFHTPTWDKMYNIVRYWAQKGVDGFRCDMVELVPEPFFKWMIEEIKSEFPSVTFIAEIYSKENYLRYIEDVKFDYLYDKSGLYDSLVSIVSKNHEGECNTVEPWQSTKRITQNWQYLSSAQSRMLNFLENHDERRFASSFFGRNPLYAGAPLCISALFNNAAFMLYFGQELGEKGGTDGRTSIFNIERGESIDKLNSYIHNNYILSENENRVLDEYRDILSFAASPLISKGQIFDLCYCNYNSSGFDFNRHFAFIRKDGERAVLFFANFSSSDASVILNIPQHASEIIGVKDGDVSIYTKAHDFSYKTLDLWEEKD